MEQGLVRKLAVILHADVVGSTLLVQKDESAAHDRIRRAFQRFSETKCSVIRYRELECHEFNERR